MVKHILVLIILLTATTGIAHAYLDPGTGSIMIQAISGILLAGVFTFKIWIKKVQQFFSKKPKVPSDDEK